MSTDRLHDPESIARIAPQLALLLASDGSLRRELALVLASEAEACAHECLHRAATLDSAAAARRSLADAGTFLLDRARAYREPRPEDTGDR